MSSPSKLSHFVLQTNDIARLREFYRTLLDARVQADLPSLCLLAYDDEHHRVALVDREPLGKHSGPTAGVHHIGFTYESLAELLANYERLKAAGIAPAVCVNHGPTTSLYYRDPDGNQIELLADVFATSAEALDYMNSAAWQANPSGVIFDPDAMLRELRAGVAPAALMRRPD